MWNIFFKLIVALGFGVKRHWHILFAIILGFGLGIVFHGSDSYDGMPGWQGTEAGDFVFGVFDFVAKVFIRLISMLVIPLVVSSLIVGVSSLKDARQLGRMGGKVLSFFMLFMVIATIIGAGLSMVFNPGDKVRDFIQAETQMQAEQTSELSTQPAIDMTKKLSGDGSDWQELLLNMIPENPIRALDEGNLVPAIVFTLLFGFAIAFIGPAGKPLISFFEAMFTATMKIVDWVMVLAVPGVFSLAFVTVAKSGMDVFVSLAPFATVLILGLLIQILIVFPIMLRVLANIDFLNLYRAISEAMLIAFGTASSSATLPITIANCELRGGISNRIASFVLPTGASINKTATTMFEVIAVMFLCQAYGIDLGLGTIVKIMVFSILASIAAAGVPSAGLITMGLVLNSLGENFSPALFSGGIALLWSIDRVLDMCRTVVNVISSCTVAAIVAAGEGELKRDVLNSPETWREVV